jgi:hypothetical protein
LSAITLSRSIEIKGTKAINSKTLNTLKSICALAICLASEELPDIKSTNVINGLKSDNPITTAVTLKNK